MNSENEFSNEEAEPVKKSGSAKWWLLGGGGCGCLVVILGCGGVFAFAFSIMMAMQQSVEQAKVLVIENSNAQEAFGTPITISDTQPVQNGQEMTYTMPISGSKASGELIVVMEITELSTNVTTKSVTVKMDDGTVIDLDSEDEFSIDIDDGEF